jgi:hypothetical protein
VGRLRGLLVTVLIEGRSVGARLRLEDVVVVAVLDVPDEVVVKVGRAVLVLVSDGALPLVNVRSALELLDVAAGAAELVSDMMGGGWECGRPGRYRGTVQSVCMDFAGVASTSGWKG